MPVFFSEHKIGNYLCTTKHRSFLESGYSKHYSKEEQSHYGYTLTEEHNIYVQVEQVIKMHEENMLKVQYILYLYPKPRCGIVCAVVQDEALACHYSFRKQCSREAVIRPGFRYGYCKNHKKRAKNGHENGESTQEPGIIKKSQPSVMIGCSNV
nr:hypothetical protein [Tanacetum cinerariifolium]